MKQIYYLPLVMLLATSCATGDKNTTDNTCDYTQYVDPKIGSGGHGHVFVGANVPFGMVQLGPTSIPQSWDWCSGYHDSDSTVIGFSHTHFSGTGIGDLFDVTVMPVVGEVTYARGTEDNPQSGMWSYGDRSKELVEPGYYAVPLTRYGVYAEMTATDRTGLHRYTFPASDSSAIIFDMENGGCWDKVTEASIKPVGNNRVEGFRNSTGWAKDQKVYFAAEFSKPFDNFELKGNDLYGRASFKTDTNEQILVKVALSPVSIEGARANLAAEMPGWDFEATRKAAHDAWNNELGKIKAESDNPADMKKFYTALYHTMASPVINNDINGEYCGADGTIHKKESTNYTLFSLWDTYRAEMPLMSLIHPERNADMINSMIDIAEQQGRLPVWYFWGNETDCMVGNPGVIVVADAIVKNVPGIDRKRAYEAILMTASDTIRGNGYRQKYGFIPSDLMKNESIAFDMEYAIADAAVAEAAKAMGDTANMRKFTELSQSYRNYLDKETGFVRGRFSDGKWRTPFNPNSSNHRSNDYCEGNAWQYTWLVPHDIQGLVDFFGSKENTIAKLDTLFTTDAQLEGEDVSPDISGLIGQYAHGNEPSHHVIYFYSMLGEPDKTADLIHRVVDEFYTTNPDGLAGNEDAGQMSAWYIMSSLGFYQVEPASGKYWFGTPLFKSTQMNVPGGTFTVKANNLSPENRYIRNVTLNGKKYDNMYIMHDDIIKGGELVFDMGPAK